MKELIKKMNELKIVQKNGAWEECIPSNIWDKYFNNKHVVVAHGLSIDTHRWYELSVTVIKIAGKLMGIKYITNLFSEASSYEDCYHYLQFYEMELIKTISYKIKTKE